MSFLFQEGNGVGFWIAVHFHLFQLYLCSFVGGGGSVIVFVVVPAAVVVAAAVAPAAVAAAAVAVAVAVIVVDDVVVGAIDLVVVVAAAAVIVNVVSHPLHGHFQQYSGIRVECTILIVVCALHDVR